MTIHNINSSASFNLADINEAISTSTTLNELIKRLGQIHKLDKMPTPKALRENETEVAAADGCVVYGNGYAVYDNGVGRTVMFVGDCLSFTYYFDPLNNFGKKVQKIILVRPYRFRIVLVSGEEIEAEYWSREEQRWEDGKEDHIDSGDEGSIH
ncbi:MAG: hypothetical protein MR488_10345 [Lachnospiraceae bacterium]|nr:hypothetical protein [Lachnospiraceae bacterium]